MPSISLSQRLINAWTQSGGKPNKLRTRKSMVWFANFIKSKLTNVSLSQLKNDGVLVSTPRPGMLVTYYYDAKHKDTLPVWDSFPLVLITSVDGDSWKGINLHYIPEAGRFYLMLQVLKAIEIGSTDRQKQQAAMRALSAMYGRFGEYTKMYLANHLKSPIVSIDTTAYEMVVSMPTARWHYNS